MKSIYVLVECYTNEKNIVISQEIKYHFDSDHHYQNIHYGEVKRYIEQMNEIYKNLGIQKFYKIVYIPELDRKDICVPDYKIHFLRYYYDYKKEEIQIVEDLSELSDDTSNMEEYAETYIGVDENGNQIDIDDVQLKNGLIPLGENYFIYIGKQNLKVDNEDWKCLVTDITKHYWNNRKKYFI
jgi:hypothetical protein